VIQAARSSAFGCPSALLDSQKPASLRHVQGSADIRHSCAYKQYDI
jgi:hypothetical protein